MALLETLYLSECLTDLRNLGKRMHISYWVWNNVFRNNERIHSCQFLDLGHWHLILMVTGSNVGVPCKRALTIAYKYVRG